MEWEATGKRDEELNILREAKIEPSRRCKRQMQCNSGFEARIAFSMRGSEGRSGIAGGEGKGGE